VSLGEQQRLFVKLIGQLIDFTYSQGYELTFGDAYRDPRLAQLNAQQGKGISNSLHSQRLAVDFNLFKDGQYLPKSEDYRPLGDFWKSLNPLCCWGGDFGTLPDGNHFSMTFGGVK
jgi:hypothetical protein